MLGRFFSFAPLPHSPVLHLKISPFGFRVKTHIAFMMNFWMEYICAQVFSFFFGFVIVVAAAYFSLQLHEITVLRSDKQALCVVQVFFSTFLVLRLCIFCSIRLWFVKMVEWAWGRRERLISSSTILAICCCWWNKIYDILSVWFFPPFSLFFCLPLALPIQKKNEFAIFACSSLCILCIHSWKCANIY